MMGYDLVLKALDGFSHMQIGTSFQFDLQGSAQTTCKPCRPEGQDHPGRNAGRTCGGRLKPSTNTPTRTKPPNLQPFFADKNTVQQSYPSPSRSGQAWVCR
jgi:hypothetical protein